MDPSQNARLARLHRPSEAWGRACRHNLRRLAACHRLAMRDLIMTIAGKCPTGTHDIELTLPTTGPGASPVAAETFLPIAPKNLLESGLTDLELESLMM